MKFDAFHYELPSESVGEAKTSVRFCRSETLSASVQIVREGGETNLHAHHGADAIWYVLAGQAAFYDEDDEKVILKKNDSVVIPSGTKYWFESAGDEPLEILHVVASDLRAVRKREDSRPRVVRSQGMEHLQAHPVTTAV